VPERVTLTIDGKECSAEKGAPLIKVAQDNGVYIPRFCWHERMAAVGMCRMCLVEVDGIRGLPAACTTTVTDGMVVHTQSESDAARKAQEGVLEFLLINHPLDCPVCDRGGECPLQDLTVGFGPGDSRFVEEKRHLPKPIPISELVLLDQERCILCARCTRFADEIAGDPLISFVERGDHTVVLNYPDDPFTSYFSGNTVQICPVGALTAKPYRFRARPWDLQSVESSCQVCAVGCRVALQSTTNRLVRSLGVDSEAVNQGWLCDKGRFGFEYVHSPDRVSEPHVRREGTFVEVTWPEALDETARGLRHVIDVHGPGAVALIGGARGTNEDTYVWTRFMKSVLKTDNVDCQLGDGLPSDCVLGLPRATIADADRAKAIVLLGPDIKEELPVLYLRLRRAAVELGVPLIDIGTRDTGLSRYATVRLRHQPGEAAELASRLMAAVGGTPSGDAATDAAAELLRADGRDGEVVVVLGRPSLAEHAGATVAAASALSELPEVRFLSALRRGNVHGALDMGLTPGMLPGRVSLADGTAWFREQWGAVPSEPGLDTEGILNAAVAGRIHALVILGSNPVDDFPDRQLARRALESIGFIVAVGAYITETSKLADVVLPSALYGEKSGTTTNIEGRVMRIARKITPAGTSMSDWRIASELALRFDADFDLETAEEVEDEIARVVPAYHGVDAAMIRQAREGVVVPMGDHEDVVLGTPGHAVAPVADTDPAAIGGVGELEHSQQSMTNPDEGTAPVTAEPPATRAGVPAIHRFTKPAPGPELPQRDAYALRLVAGRKLYDAGMVALRSPSLTRLAEPAVLVISESDAQRLGITDGEEVKVSSARSSFVVRARSDASLARGVAFLPFIAPGPSANDLIDSSQAVTDVRVETTQ
jgi:NADH-quinone oxidoreductase subunit G